MEDSLQLSRIASQSDRGGEARKKGPSLQTLLEEFNKMEELAKPKRAKKPSKTSIPKSENKLLQGLQPKFESQTKQKYIDPNWNSKPSSLRGLSHDDGTRKLTSYIGTSLKAITNPAQESQKKPTVRIVNEDDSKPRMTLKPIELSKYVDETQEPSLFPRYHAKNEPKAKHFSVPSILEINPESQTNLPPHATNKLSKLVLSTKSGSLSRPLQPESLTARDSVTSRSNLQLLSLDPSPRGRPLIESFSSRQSANALLPMSNDYLLKIILAKNDNKTMSHSGSPRKLQSSSQDYQFAKRGSFAVFKTVIENETYRK